MGLWTQLALQAWFRRVYIEEVGLVIHYFKMKRNCCCVPLNLSGGLKVLEHFASYCFPFRNVRKNSFPGYKILCVSVLPAFMAVHHVCFWCPWWPEEGISHVNGGNQTYQIKSVSFTAELSLQHPKLFFCTQNFNIIGPSQASSLTIPIPLCQSQTPRNTLYRRAPDVRGLTRLWLI